MFGKNKNKVKNKNKTSKWLIFIIIVVVFIFAGIQMGSYLSELDFGNIDDLYSAYTELEKGVEESVVVNYQVSTLDEIKNNETITSLGVLKADDTVDLDLATAESSFTLTDKDLGQLINLDFRNNENLDDFVLKQLKITTGVGNIYSINSVVALVGVDNFADIYVTTNTNVNASLQVLSSSVKINDLDENKNKIVLESIKDMFDSSIKIESYVTEQILNRINDLSTTLQMGYTIVPNGISFN